MEPFATSALPFFFFPVDTYHWDSSPLGDQLAEGTGPAMVRRLVVLESTLFFF